MALWRFRAHQLDEKFRNPIQGEFFSGEAVERPAQALVRDVIRTAFDGTSEPFGTTPDALLRRLLREVDCLRKATG